MPRAVERATRVKDWGARDHAQPVTGTYPVARVSAKCQTRVLPIINSNPRGDHAPSQPILSAAPRNTRHPASRCGRDTLELPEPYARLRNN